MGNVFVAMLPYRKFFPNCAWRAALHAAGCTKVCVEQASGAQRERPLEGVSVHREPEETTLA
jgi:hypothetical protein